MNTRKLLICILVMAVSTGYAQTFTMGKKCREALASAQAALSSQSYQDALALYQAFAGDCKTTRQCCSSAEPPPTPPRFHQD